MEGLMGISAIAWVISIVAAVILFLLPFFVFRIRNELIEINRVNKRILVLLESVVPESKKPKTIICKTCRTINEERGERCLHCGEKLSV